MRFLIALFFLMIFIRDSFLSAFHWVIQSNVREGVIHVIDFGGAMPVYSSIHSMIIKYRCLSNFKNFKLPDETFNKLKNFNILNVRRRGCRAGRGRSRHESRMNDQRGVNVNNLIQIGLIKDDIFYV